LHVTTHRSLLDDERGEYWTGNEPAMTDSRIARDNHPGRDP
jgi:hypothetical protein